jgi:hypothetical protein
VRPEPSTLVNTRGRLGYVRRSLCVIIRLG